MLIVADFVLMAADPVLILLKLPHCHLSSAVEQLFCKQQVLGPNPRGGSPTHFPHNRLFWHSAKFPAVRTEIFIVPLYPKAISLQADNPL